MTQALAGFFKSIYLAVMKVIDFSRAKVVLVCSNGYLNQQLVKTMDELSLKEDKVLHGNLAKFVCLHTANGNVDALKVGRRREFHCRR